MNLTIKSKLIGGFVVIIVLLLSMAFFMTNKLSESNQRLLKIVDVSSKRINLSNELMFSVLEAARYEKNIIMQKDPVKKDLNKERIYKALESIDKKTSELEELADEKGKVLMKEFENTWSDYKPDLNNIILLVLKNNDEAFKISIERGVKVRAVVFSQLERLVDKNEKGMENDKIENNASYNTALSL